MINNIKSQYRTKIKRQFLGLKDINLIEKKIIKLGYSTSKIIKQKNIERVTATDIDKNRIEFILSDKNLYIIIYLGFSNNKKDKIFIYSTNKEFLKDDYFSKKDITKSVRDMYSNYMSFNMDILNKVNNQFYSAEDIYLNKNKISTQNIFIQKMTTILSFSNIRNKIINNEIKDLPILLDISGNKKDKLIEKFSISLLFLIINNNNILFNTDPNDFYSYEEYSTFLIQSILLSKKVSNRNILYGNFFYPLIYNKYSFELYELDYLLEKEVIPNIIKNKSLLFDILIHNKKFISEKFGNFLSHNKETFLIFLTQNLFDELKIINEKWQSEVNFELIDPNKLIRL